MSDFNNYLLCSLDPGGSSDPAAVVVAKVARRDHITKSQVLHLSLKKPVVTPMMHVEFVQQTMAAIFGAFGFATVRYICDVSNNSAIAYLLAQSLPRDSLVGCKITNSDSHAAGVSAMLIGDVGGRATSIPMLSLSRRQLLLDVGLAFQTGQLSLPLTDSGQQRDVLELKKQMSRASLKISPSGREISVVERGHDDLLMALAQLLAATRLPPPRTAKSRGERAEPVTSAAWT